MTTKMRFNMTTARAGTFYSSKKESTAAQPETGKTTSKVLVVKIGPKNSSSGSMKKLNSRLSGKYTFDGSTKN